jgi:hypothetical protein
MTIPQASSLSPTCVGSGSVLHPPTLAAFGGMDESAHLHMPFAKCGFGKLAIRGMDGVAIFVDRRCVHTGDVGRFFITATPTAFGEHLTPPRRRA